MVLAQARMEVRLLLRNGEQVAARRWSSRCCCWPRLLAAGLVDLGAAARAVDFLAPGVLALAVMSTAFTGLAIATGFERRYGVLKRLGATPLPRAGLLAGKTLAVLVVEVVQVVLIGAVGARAGLAPARRPARLARSLAARRRSAPRRSPALGLLMAGTLRPRRPWPARTWSTCCCWSAARAGPGGAYPAAIRPVIGCCRRRRWPRGCGTFSARPARRPPGVPWRAAWASWSSGARGRAGDARRSAGGDPGDRPSWHLAPADSARRGEPTGARKWPHTRARQVPGPTWPIRGRG